ncbi:hypothetical protein PHLCEN_2v6312 [Hermanssonia centrifuga]|uniref:NAD(P)-binding domain-containing protein n=1 Tax=Hermanssonia centrifuga TaxID=98765 RepID=A0A2R6NZT3_9APHY|nr:hypothetical protein PHLCEN_2v6312 [Hermanssonia centrifuga]
MVKYVLTGSTGELGSPNDVIVSLYNPAGATADITNSGVEVRKGDFAQPETLDAAYKGGDKLLIVSYPSINHEIRVKSHVAAIDAAKRAGIQHIYYTSLAFAGDSSAAVMQAHIDTEAYLRSSGLTYTIIREGIYSESFPLYFGYWSPSREGNEVLIPQGDGGIAWVCREDLGEGTAKLMVADTHKNETILFSGSHALTLGGLAALISTILGRDPPLRVKEVSVDAYVANNQGSEELLRKWATTYPALARGELAVVDPLLREILGRDLTPFEDTLREVLGVMGDGGAAAVKRYNKLRE